MTWSFFPLTNMYIFFQRNLVYLNSYFVVRLNCKCITFCLPDINHTRNIFSEFYTHFLKQRKQYKWYSNSIFFKKKLFKRRKLYVLCVAYFRTPRNFYLGCLFLFQSNSPKATMYFFNQLVWILNNRFLLSYINHFYQIHLFLFIWYITSGLQLAALQTGIWLLLTAPVKGSSPVSGLPHRCTHWTWLSHNYLKLLQLEIAR